MSYQYQFRRMQVELPVGKMLKRAVAKRTSWIIGHIACDFGILSKILCGFGSLLGLSVPAVGLPSFSKFLRIYTRTPVMRNAREVHAYCHGERSGDHIHWNCFMKHSEAVFKIPKVLGLKA